MNSLTQQIQCLSLGENPSDASIKSPRRSARHPESRKNLQPDAMSQRMGNVLTYTLGDQREMRASREIPDSIMVQSLLTDECILSANTQFPILIQKISDTAAFILQFPTPFTIASRLINGQRKQFEESMIRFFTLLGQEGARGQKFHLVFCAEAIQTISKEHLALLQTNICPYAVKIRYLLSKTEHTTDLQNKLCSLIICANKVEYIDFSDCSHISVHDLSLLFIMPPKGFTSLFLDNCMQLTDDWIKKFSENPHFELLSSISLCGCSTLSDTAFCAIFSKNNSIRSFSASRCMITKTFFEHLNALLYTTLSHLELEECTITQEIVIAICSSHYQLVSLSLCGCKNIQPKWCRAIQEQHKNIRISCTQDIVVSHAAVDQNTTYCGPTDEMLKIQMPFLERIRQQKWCNATELAAYVSSLLGETEVVSDGQWFSFILKKVETRPCSRQILTDEIIHYFATYKIALTVSYAALTYSSKTMIGRFLRELAPHCKRVTFIADQNPLGIELEAINFSQVVELGASNTQIDGEHFRLLKFEKLEYVLLRNCQNAASLFQYIPSPNQLKILDIRGCKLADHELTLALQKSALDTRVRFTPQSNFSQIGAEDDVVRLIVSLARLQKRRYDGIIRSLVQKLQITEQNYATLFYLAGRFAIDILKREGLDFWFSTNGYRNYFLLSWNDKLHLNFRSFSMLSSMTESHWSFVKTFQSMQLAVTIDDDLKLNEQTNRQKILQCIASNLGAKIESLCYCGKSTAIPDAAFCASLKNLQEITVSNHLSPYAVLDVFLKNCSTVTSLSIHSCTNFTGKQVATILQSHAHITKFSISGASHLKQDGFEEILKSASHVAELDLTGCIHLTDTPLLDHREQLKNLKVLNLSGCVEITDHALVNTYNFQQLTSLDLSYTKITDVGLQNLSFKCPGLRVLRLGSTKVSLKMITLPALMEEVYLQSCSGINDESLAHLACELGLLQRLDLSYCSHITEEGISKVISICPKIVVINIQGCKTIDPEVARVLSEENRRYSSLNATDIKKFTKARREIIIRRGEKIDELQTSYTCIENLIYLIDIFKIFQDRKGKKLKILELLNCTEDPAVVFLSAKAYLLSLKILMLSGKTTASTLHTLVSLKNLTSLVLASWDMDHESLITDDALAKVARDLVCLQSIHLEDLRHITHIGIQLMIQNNQVLKHITVTNCRLIAPPEIQALQSQYEDQGIRIEHDLKGKFNE